jgi:hypothetical protein
MSVKSGCIGLNNVIRGCMSTTITGEGDVSKRFVEELKS